MDECLGEDGSGGGAVASDIVSLLGNFLDQLGADLFVGLFKFNFFSDGDAIVSDGGGSPLLF